MEKRNNVWKDGDRKTEQRFSTLELELEIGDEDDAFPGGESTTTTLTANLRGLQSTMNIEWVYYDSYALTCIEYAVCACVLLNLSTSSMRSSIMFV